MRKKMLRVEARDLHADSVRCRLLTTRKGAPQMATKYGSTAQSKVKKAMHERKEGTLKSGKSGKKVTSKKQAIAIGLSEARKEGGKVPSKKSKKTSR
jgi:hypothetical protein